MGYVIDPPERASLAVAGSADRFPVRRIFCVGRNYLDHVREMGNDERELPFFFAKPADAVVESGATIPYPSATGDLHHEIELVVAIGRGGRDLSPGAAAGHVWGATVGVDLTRRDLQAEAKSRGRPWDMAKGFDRSAPMGALVPMADVPALDRGAIWLEVNGARRQSGDLSEMIWPVAEHLAILSGLVELRPGDLVMTGTPAGVGSLAPGDRVRGGVAGLGEVDFAIAG